MRRLQGCVEIPAMLPGERAPNIELLSDRQWREAYELDTTHVKADLNWPEPLLPTPIVAAYGDDSAICLMVGKRDLDYLRFSRPADRIGFHLWRVGAELPPDPSRSSRLRGATGTAASGKAIRRLHYLPRRNVRIDHPEADERTAPCCVNLALPSSEPHSCDWTFPDNQGREVFYNGNHRRTPANTQNDRGRQD